MNKFKTIGLGLVALFAVSCVATSCGGGGGDDNSESIVFHYHREDDKYTGWDLWLWPDGGSGAGYEFNKDVDDYGAVAKYPVATWPNSTGINFIVRQGGSAWSAKDPDGDRSLLYADFPVDSNNQHNVYLYTGDENIYSSPTEASGPKISTCKFLSMTKILFATTVIGNTYSIYEGDTEVKTGNVAKDNKNNTIDLGDDFNVDFSKAYKVKVTFENSVTRTADCSVFTLFDNDEFGAKYNYDGELGAIYAADKTTFKVWAPTSTAVTLKLYDNGTPTSVDATKGSDVGTTKAMTRGDKGVYSITVDGNLAGKYYTYIVSNSLGTNETIDPYALSAGVNGIRGQIVNFADTDPEGWDTCTVPQISNTELAVYEAHVADVTSDSSWTGTEANRKKFLGMAETGTTYTASGKTVTTGFDSIKELGINAIQILPFYDQANDETSDTFNWGYNPLNYNVMEGQYSSNPYDGYVRIKEAKEMIMAYNNSGIKVIMDVVYNHVNSLDSSSFNMVVPGYYFRYNGTAPSNGSGCGNETASNRQMFRKFMIDSTSFLAEEYKLGGFRFDLMGIHDTVTMGEIEEKLETINPTITVYGEPWTGGTIALPSGFTSAAQASLKKTEMAEVGAFNDKFRDGVKGSVFSEIGCGWLQNEESTDSSAVVGGLLGYTNTKASHYNYAVKQNINYVSCHDNNTLYDKLYLSAGDLGDDVLSKMDVEANALVLAGQGISFIQAGEELMREKKNADGSRNSNSYNASYEVNTIKWSRKIQFSNEFEYYKKMVNLKTTDSAFQYDNFDDIAANVTASGDDTITLTAKGDGDYVMYFNNRVAEASVTIPTGYVVYMDNYGTAAGTSLSGSLKLKTNQALVLVKA